MRIWLFPIAIIAVYCGCAYEKNRPLLSTNYLQSILSEIKKIDSTARILNFVSEEKKFEFLDYVITTGSFDIQDPKVKGELISVTEKDYKISKQLTTDSFLLQKTSATHFVYSGNKISEKHFADSTENKIYRVKYNNSIVDQVVTLYKKENDSIKTKLIYEKGRLATKRLYSSKGVMFITEKLIYKDNGNLDYQYIIDNEGGDEFEKLEFNNGKRQLIITRFDKNKNLLWLKYSEFDKQGKIVYEERVKKQKGTEIFRRDRYVFDDYGEIIYNEGFWPKSQLKMIFKFQYTKRESLGNWIERRIFEDDRPIIITKRTIRYLKYKESGNVVN